MEATFAEASANDHVARLVAKDFCGGESNVENGAGGRVRDGYCWLRDGYCWAVRREPVLLAAPQAVSFDRPLEDWTTAPTLSAAASL